jgi:hypothetical protein
MWQATGYASTEDDLPDRNEDWTGFTQEEFEAFRIRARKWKVPLQYQGGDAQARANGYKSAAHCWLMNCMQKN